MKNRTEEKGRKEKREQNFSNTRTGAPTRYIPTSLMQPSKTTLNLPSSSLHLCSPLKEIRRVKIRHQFTLFPK